MLTGSLFLWLGLAASLAGLATVVVNHRLAPRPVLDAACRVLLGTLALLLSLVLAYQIGAGGAQRIALVEDLYALLDSWLAVLGFTTPLVEPLVRRLLLGLGVGQLFDHVAWHLALLGPLVALSAWILLRGAILLVGALIAQGVRLLGGRLLDRLEDLANGFGRLLERAGVLLERHRAMHGAAKTAAVSWGLLGLSLAFILAAVDRTTAGDLMEPAADIVWVGGFIFFLELWGASRRFAATAAWPSGEADEERQRERKKSLAELVAAYDELDDAILLKREIAAFTQVPVAAGPPIAAGATALMDWLRTEGDVPKVSLDALATALDGMRQRHEVLLFEETLAEPHYRVLLELIQNAQDDGGTILIVCPDGAGGEIEAALQQASRVFFTDLIRQTAVLDRQQAIPQDFFQLAIVPESSFELLLDGDGELGAWRRRLSLLVVLELSRLDAALLHTRLARMFPDGPARGRDIMVQSEALGDVVTLTRSIFGLDVTRAVRPVRLHTVIHTRRFLRVFDGEVETGRYLVQAFFADRLGAMPALDPLTLLLIPAWRDDWQPRHFDPDHRRDREARADLTDDYLAPHQDLNRILARPTGDGSEHYLKAGPVSPVVFTDDSANLVVPVQRAYAFRKVDELFLGIVARAYPLRDMLVQKAGEAESTGALGSWLPLAPRPGFGAFELANLLLPRLCRPGGVARDVVESIMRRAPGRVREALGVGPNAAGVQKLFEHLTPTGSTAPTVRRSGGVPERYAIDPPDHARARRLLDVHLPMLLGREVQSARVPRGDHGLTFAEGTLLMTPREGGGQFFRVAGVGNNGVGIVPASYRAGKFRLPPSYTFARIYRLALDKGPVAVEDEQVVQQGALTRRARHLHARFTRMTEGYYLMGSGGTQLVTANASYVPLNEAIAVERPFRSVLHLQLARSDQDGDGAPPRTDQIAISLCILLHDVLAALFPRHAHRLAVVSPQAQALYAQALAPSAPILDRLVVRRYARLQGYEGFDPAVVDLFLIEDADYDLGVVRAVHHNLNAVVNRVASYADWLIATADGAGRPPFHAFGEAAPPGWLDVKAMRPFL